ncbi:MAG: hypothetical protein WA090_03850 [Candidatus Nanopelagicaceae bacterium]
MTTVGGDLGTIGLLGLLVLVIWAIAPRWRSFVPKRFQRYVHLGIETKVVKNIHRRFKGYPMWRQFHRLTGIFVAAGFAHGIIEGTVFGSRYLRFNYLIVGGIGMAFYVYRELFLAILPKAMIIRWNWWTCWEMAYLKSL